VLPPIQSLPRIKLKEFFDQIWPIKVTRRHVHYKDAALITAKLSGRFKQTPHLHLMTLNVKMTMAIRN